MSAAQKFLEEENDIDIVEKYHQLQTDHYQLEDEHFALKKHFKRAQRCSKILFLLLIIAGIGISGYFWHEELSSFFPGAPGQDDQGDKQKEKLVTVKKHTLRNTLSLTGKIEPLGQIDVVASLEGMVLEKNFQYGDFVKKDTVLLTINTDNEQVKYRAAQADYLKAEAELKALENWKKSLDVVGIKHDLTRIQYKLTTTQRELKKTRRLFKKGIVASSEVEQLEEKYQNQQVDLEFQKERLVGTLEKGSEENVHIAALKRENSLLKMKAIEERIEKAQLVSPIDGVILLPVSRKTETPLELQPGSFVQQDQVLFTIANLQGFNIRSQVDENDILKLQLGQDVTITGDAFQDDLILTGTVQYISFQADQLEYGRPSSFSARIAVASPTDEQKKRLLLGMSADMEVLISEKPNAIIIPFALVSLDDKNQAWVIKVIEETGETEKVKVEIGVTEANTVEILEGLEVGDKIMREPLSPSVKQ